MRCTNRWSPEANRPAVSDFGVLDDTEPPTIERVLPRRYTLTRAAGGAGGAGRARQINAINAKNRAFVPGAAATYATRIESHPCVPCACKNSDMRGYRPFR